MDCKQIDAFRKEWAPAALSVMRVVFAYLFILHGLMKFGVLSGELKMATGKMLVAGSIEVIGGLLLLIGLWTSYVAFLAAGEMAFAYFLAHVGSKGMVWNPLANGGEAAVLFCFAFLALFFLGGGKWSVDAACKKK